MDFLRIFLSLLCLVLPSLSQAQSSLTNNTGIVFVHGTNNHSTDADGSYWKTEFTQSIINALPQHENHLIVHCDFSQYMWHEQAAGCVANQVLNFIESKHIDSLIVYTHSNGANVTRWILSNPTYDPRYLKIQPLIKKVIAIAPSSGGTPLADETLNGNIFEAGLGWLLGYHNDSVRQQRVGDMAIFNEHLLFGTQNRPTLPTPFKVIIGTSVNGSLSGTSSCNGYLLNTALLITKIYLDKCADGFLNCSSQRAAGDLWFNDIEKTENQIPLSHNQSRHSCFGLEQLLIQDLHDQGALS